MEVVKLLLERDDIAVDKVIALEIACEHENREVALFLLNHPKVDVEDSVREEYNDFITSLQ